MCVGVCGWIPHQEGALPRRSVSDGLCAVVRPQGQGGEMVPAVPVETPWYGVFYTFHVNHFASL